MSAATAALKNQAACAVSADEFLANAGNVECNIGGMPVYATPRTPSPDKTLGWYASAKIPVKIGGKLVMCQVGLNVNVIGSRQ